MNYTYNDIAGYATEKEELSRLCEIFNNREKYEAKGAQLPKGVIFYGESGTGKTLFAKVMASACNSNVIKIDVSEIENETTICQRIKAAFIQAENNDGTSIIFFDELDKVLPNEFEDVHTEREKTVLAQLLTLIDGMDSCNKVVFVATCNHYGALPNTLTRPGRIDKKIHIGLPTFQSRTEILQMYANQSTCTFELPMESIAKFCAGFSGAALKTLINECILQSDENGFISEKLIMLKIAEINNEDIPRQQSAYNMLICAHRNVGEFVIGNVLHESDYVLSLRNNTVCNNFFDGILSEFDDDFCREDEEDCYDDDEEWDDNEEESEHYDDEEDDEEEWYDEDNEDYYDDDDDYDCDRGNYYSKYDYLDTITVLLGGYAAEEIFLGRTYDNLYNSFSLIDEIFDFMLRQGMFGLKNRYSNSRQRESLPYTDKFVTKINKVYDKTIDLCYKNAKKILMRNKNAVERITEYMLSDELTQQGDYEEISQLIDEIY